MAVVYLRHPIHGQLAESNEMMIAVHKVNGWEEFDPSARTEPEVVPVTDQPEAVVPDFLKGSKKK